VPRPPPSPRPPRLQPSSGRLASRRPLFTGKPPVVLPAEGVSLDSVERELIQQALERADGNKSAAARLLGLSRDTLRYRLEKHGLS